MPPIESCIIDSRGIEHQLTKASDPKRNEVDLTTLDREGTRHTLRITSLPTDFKGKQEGYIGGDLMRSPQQILATSSSILPGDRIILANLNISEVNGNPFKAPAPHKLSIEAPEISKE